MFNTARTHKICTPPLRSKYNEYSWKNKTRHLIKRKPHIHKAIKTTASPLAGCFLPIQQLGVFAHLFEIRCQPQQSLGTLFGAEIRRCDVHATVVGHVIHDSTVRAVHVVIRRDFLQHQAAVALQTRQGHTHVPHSFFNGVVGVGGIVEVLVVFVFLIIFFGIIVKACHLRSTVGGLLSQAWLVCGERRGATAFGATLTATVFTDAPAGRCLAMGSDALFGTVEYSSRQLCEGGTVGPRDSNRVHASLETARS